MRAHIPHINHKIQRQISAGQDWKKMESMSGVYLQENSLLQETNISSQSKVFEDK